MSEKEKQRYSRTRLNQGQIAILELLYKYRFGSRALLGESLELKSGSSLHTKLEVLTTHGYIAKRYDKKLKLQAVPVAYYLLPKGLRTLQALPDHEYIDDKAARTSYKDKTVGNDFIAHTLSIYKQTRLLQRQYPGLKVFTKHDISRYQYFPEKLPDAFLSLASNDPKQPHRFFLDVIPDRMPMYVLNKRMTNYAEFFDEGGWDETESPVPVILLLIERQQAEKRIQRTVRAQLSRLGAELRIYTSTTRAIEAGVIGKTLWNEPDNFDESVSLDNIPVNL